MLIVFQMPGQLGGLKPRKRKITSEVKGSKKVCVSCGCVIWLLLNNSPVDPGHL